MTATVEGLLETGTQFLDDLRNDPELRRQFELEDNMKAEGAARYQRKREKAAENGTEGDLIPQKDLIRDNILKVASAIVEYLDADTARLAALAEAKSRNRKPLLPTKWLRQLPATAIAFIGLKCVFNGLGSARATTPLAKQIGQAIEEEIIVSQFAQTEEKLYASIVNEFTSRSTIHHRRVLKAAIQRHRPDLLDANEGNQNQQIVTGLVVIEAIIRQTGLFEDHVESEGGKTTEVIRLTQLAREYIEKRHAVAQFFTPLYKPTIILPRAWTSTRTGGYHGVLAGRHAVVRGKNSDKKYMAQLKATDMPVIYRGLNLLQNTQFKINTAILDLMEPLVGVSTLGGLPDVTPVSIPERLPLPEKREEWTEEHVEAFKKWKALSKAAWKESFEHEQDLGTITQCMLVANEYRDEPRFYFPWSLDSRGRAYPIARGLQPQGTDWQKALLQFARGRVYDDVARYFLAFHLANCKGETETGVKLDKSKYAERVEWTMHNTDTIMDVADDPMAHTWFWEDAESPWMLVAACIEWTRCERMRYAGLPAETFLAPALDGSCNGLQHFSAALLDEIGGKAVNLTANIEPNDIYKVVCEKLKAALEEIAKGEAEGVITQVDEEGKETYKLCDVSMARRWLESRQVDRDLCKQPVMTMPYGSNQQGIKGQFLNKMKKRRFKFTPLPWMDQKSDGFAECTFLAKVIWKAIGATVVKAREAMDWLQGAARIANKAGIAIEWTSPAGLPVKQFYEDRKDLRIETQFFGKMYRPQVTDMAAAPKLSKHEQVNGISPNFVHSLDASAMMLTICALADQGVEDFWMIHDSYAVPCCQTQMLWDTLRVVFVDMYSSTDVLKNFRDTLLEALPEDLRGNVEPLPRKGGLDLSEIERSDFFFA